MFFSLIYRGSPHIHGIFWFEGAPDVSNLESASSEYLNEVIDYFSKLIDAFNRKTDAEEANIHPCRTSYSLIEDFEEDLAQLLHKIQRHTQCKTDYCYKINKKTKQRECRFKFPKNMQETATIEKGDNGELEFKPRRNDPRLNKFHPFIIQLWRANMDIAPVISKRALICYLAKYISKSEVSSQALDEVFKTAIDSTDENMKAKKIISKVFMKSCGERDISAQEVCHSLLRLKLHSSGGRDFVYINMSKKKWIQICNEDDGDSDDASMKKGKSVLEKYMERPDRLQDKSLWECAKLYNPSRWLPVKKENIVRIFPRLILKQEEDSNEEYYKQRVLLHVPWRNETDLKDEESTWEDTYIRYNVSERDNITSKLGFDDNKCTDDDYETDEDSSDDEESGLVENLISSRFGPNADVPTISLGNREVDVNYNWQDTYIKYKEYGTIPDFQNFIDKMKEGIQKKDTDIPQLQEVEFSADQQQIIDWVQNQINSIKTSKQNSDGHIKRIIVQGKAGKCHSEFLCLHKHNIQNVVINNFYQCSLTHFRNREESHHQTH